MIKIKEIQLKPKRLKDWYKVKETEKCLVLTKDLDGNNLYYLPKKDILKISK